MASAKLPLGRASPDEEERKKKRKGTNAITYKKPIILDALGVPEREEQKVHPETLSLPLAPVPVRRLEE